jgi:HEAT repeat protein
MKPRPRNQRSWTGVFRALTLVLGAAVVLEIQFPGKVPVARDVVIQWTILRLEGYNGSGSVRRSLLAAQRLGEMGPVAEPAIPALIRALEPSRRDELSATAESALARIGPKAVPALIGALDSLHPETRDAAARALGTIGGGAEAAVEPLMRTHRENRARYTKRTSPALAALARIGPPGLEPLIQDLRHSIPETREWAAESLGQAQRIAFQSDPQRKANARRSIQPLIGTLQDDRFEVRRAAVKAIQQVALSIDDLETCLRTAEALLRALAEDSALSGEAGFALHSTAQLDLNAILTFVENGGRHERLEKNPAESESAPGTTVDRLVRIMAERSDLYTFGLLALRDIGARAIEPLVARLNDEDVQVRRIAAMQIGFILPATKDATTRTNTLGPLLRALDDSDWIVRHDAASALMEIGTEQALDAVRRTGFNPDRLRSPRSGSRQQSVGKQ